MFRIIAVLIVFAVSAVQLLGGSRWFICECGATPLAVQASHCHGLEPAPCSTETDATPCQDDEHRKEHLQVKEDLKSPGQMATSVTVPAAPMVATLPSDMIALPAESWTSSVRLPDVQYHPPPGVIVARTVVRLI